MKPWLLASLIALALPCAAAERTVDLDRPGALEALEQANPAHFAKVRRILHEAPRLPVASVQGWVRTQFNAREVSNLHVLRTSYPAQANLSFVLDDTRYSAVIRVDAPPRLTPAK
jgi:hypothetical protein